MHKHSNGGGKEGKGKGELMMRTVSVTHVHRKKVDSPFLLPPPPTAPLQTTCNFTRMLSLCT
jgi:hypothetical protein